MQDPVFSNSLGTINFAGGKPSPGFIGAAGTVFNITFKAKTSGTANVTFASGSVLADDGKGTNILANMGSGAYTLTTRGITPAIPPAETPEPETPPKITAGTLAAPVISSLTHPDPEKWYSNKNPEFIWKLPSGATGVSLIFNQNSSSDPGNTSDGQMESKKYEGVEDGIWYFHIKFRNQQGWGNITHRQVLIDTKPPEPFEIKVDQGGDPTNPTPFLYFNTKDALSGIEYYEVKVGDKEPMPVTLGYLKSNPYKTSPLEPGEHSILVKAVDKAGNSTIASTELVIQALEVPLITDFPKTIRPGEILAIKGTSKYPEATVSVFVKKEGQEPVKNEVKTDSAGNWVFVSDRTLEKGIYEIWAEVQDNKGAKSSSSDKIVITVVLSPFLKFGTIVVSYLTIVTTFIVLIAVLIAVIFYAWYRISLWRKKIRKETEEVSQAVNKAFRALREEVQEQIEKLDRSPGLTKAEKELRDKLQEALNISESFISKEIKDIEKEIE